MGILISKARELIVRGEGSAEGVFGKALVSAGGRVYKPTTEHLTVHVEKTRVQILDGSEENRGKLLLDLPCEAASQLAMDIKIQAIRMSEGVVQVIENGTLLIEVPWTSALKLARVIRHQAAIAEQSAKMAQVVMDQAFAFRAGIPIMLTRRPDAIKEAINEALHDRDLRRAFPGGIPSGVKFGSPVVRPGKPATHRIAPRGIPSGEVFGRIGGK